MTTTTIRMGIAPSKNNPDLPRALVVGDGARVRREGLDVIATTEMGDKGQDYRDFLSGLGGSGSYTAAGNTENSENPLFYNPKKFEERGGLHLPVRTPGYKGGKALYYGGVSPTRTTEVSDLVPFVNGVPDDRLAPIIINVHMTAFAFSSRFNKQPEKKRWVLANWNAHWKQIKDQVTRFHNAGRPIFILGDFNRKVTAIPKWHPDQHLIVNGGIDGIFVVFPHRMNKLNIAMISKPKTIDVPGSDHHLRYTTVRLTTQ